VQLEMLNVPSCEKEWCRALFDPATGRVRALVPERVLVKGRAARIIQEHAATAAPDGGDAAAPTYDVEYEDGGSEEGVAAESVKRASEETFLKLKEEFMEGTFKLKEEFIDSALPCREVFMKTIN
jgi:hypothetical protein